MPGNSQHRIIKGVDLTERESQVLDLFCQGKCTKEAAAELQLSPKTVEYFRFKLYDKLSPKRRSDLELVARGARMGFGFLECIWCGEPLETWQSAKKPVEYRGFCNKSCYDRDRYLRVRKRKIEQSKARQNRVIEQAHSLGLSLAKFLRLPAAAVAAVVGILVMMGSMGVKGAEGGHRIHRATNLVLEAASPMLPLPQLVPARTIYSSIGLAWDDDTDPAVAGYHLYYGGVSRAYTNMIDAGNSTTVVVSKLVVGATYYFAVTAYDIIGLESPFSAELAYTIPKPFAKPVTNVVTVTGTNIFSGPTVKGPWTAMMPTNGTSFSFTNPAPASGQQFFRGWGVKIRRVTI